MSLGTDFLNSSALKVEDVNVLLDLLHSRNARRSFSPDSAELKIDLLSS